MLIKWACIKSLNIVTYQMNEKVLKDLCYLN